VGRKDLFVGFAAADHTDIGDAETVGADLYALLGVDVNSELRGSLK
jgi:hypothetical protein